MRQKLTANKSVHKSDHGRLRIGDDWNAITIIALSQTNPLKVIAEFVENSIDAQARHITIIRGKERGEHYLKVSDDGNGLPCTEEGRPDFKYVATHICDSLKRRLKQEGAQNIQGEFGIGLLSFWTVGHRLSMVSSGRDNRTYQMSMEKDKPGYRIAPRSHLLPIKGTQLTISPLLAGIRLLNGERIQRYLASELRDRIRHTAVKIKIIDRTSRLELDVKPRNFEGRLIHDLSPIPTPFGDICTEIYLLEKNPENAISLFRGGTRLLPNISAIDLFQCAPWTSGYFQGIIDAPFLNLTPGTREGVIRDERFAKFCDLLEPLKDHLMKIALEQSKAEEEHTSKNILRSVQKALREAMLILPQEEYDWFDIGQKKAVSSDYGNGAVNKA
ncbi:MAG: ATP-binding protein, partial [Candidatus Omnitrophica bacterium]|nr:ATP-binding protein [Candidatus Omnitrophota bacterium]